MERWVGKVALVTGASAGIGAAIVEKLAQKGMKVIGCARHINTIEELALKVNGVGSGSLQAFQCDISKEDQVQAMFENIKKQHGGVDVCVNNAGLKHLAPLLSGDTENWRHMLEVNVLGLCMCTREAYKSMTEKGVEGGHIINISSIGGHRLSGHKSGYFYQTTKFAVGALTEGVRRELREVNSSIRISQISPGLTETEFQYRAAEEVPGSDGTAKAVYNSIRSMDSENIADAVVYVLSTPQHVQIHDMLIRPTEQKA